MKCWKRWGIHTILGLVLWLAWGQAAHAQTVRAWETAVSDNFAVASRWNPDGKPTGTDIAQFDVAGTYTIGFTVNESFGALSVEAGAVSWSSAAARTVNVTSINVANSGTDFRILSDVRVSVSGVTTLNAFNGTLVITAGRLTTSSLQLSQGTLIGNNALSQVTVTGTSNVGGQGLAATMNLNTGTVANFGNVNLAPAGVGAFSTGTINIASAATATVDGNLTVGNTTDDNRQGIISVTGANSQLMQLGNRNITLGRIQVGAPSGDNSSRIEVSSGGTVNTGTGAITLNNLGHINVGSTGTFNANGAMTINSAGELNITGGQFNTNSTITVNGGGIIDHTGGTFSRSADLILNGGTFTQGGSAINSTTGAVDLTVQNGGDYLAQSYSLPNGSTTTITGGGSTLQVTNGILAFGGAGTQLNINTGGVLTATSLNLGLTGTITSIVDGVGSRITANSQLSSLDAGTFTVRNAGVVQLAATNLGTTNAVATLNVQTGASMTLGNLNAGNANITGTGAVINVSGTNSVLSQTGATGFQLGGTTLGGGTIAISSGGLFSTGTGLSRINALGTLNVNAGGTFVNNGQLTVDAGVIQATAGAMNLSSGSQLILQNNALGNFGNLALTNGAQIVVDNAELRLTDLTPLGGTVNVLGGLVNFTQGTALTGGKLTGLFGSTPTLLGGRTLLVQGAATMQSQLILDGGTFTANSIVNGGLLDLRRGTVNLTASNLVVGNAGVFGSTLSLGNNMVVNVQGTGTATIDANGLLQLNGGQLNTAGVVNNNGEINMALSTSRIGGAGALNNNGTITGTGRIDKTLNNAAAGRVQANGSDRLVFAGTGNTNAGLISATNNGQVEFQQGLTNAVSTGLITGQGAVLRFNGGLTNNGAMAFTGGNMDVFGDITQNVGARITISGGGTTTFYDDVTIAPGAANIQASTTGGVISNVVFFGSYNGGVSGGGAAFIEGDHRPGNSPGLVTFGGDVFYGPVARLLVELAGNNRGTQYDAIDVTGSVAVNGTLELSVLGGFTPNGGQAFLIINNDGTDPIVGTFAGLAEGATFLVDNHLYQISYIGGSGNDLMLTAVPEPSTWAMLAFTMLGAGLYYGHRQKKAQQQQLNEVAE